MLVDSSRLGGGICHDERDVGHRCKVHGGALGGKRAIVIFSTVNLGKPPTYRGHLLASVFAAAGRVQARLADFG